MCRDLSNPGRCRRLRTPCLPTGSEAGAGKRTWLIGSIALTLLVVMPPASAAILWSEPGAVLVHDSGPGRDLLDGALKRDDSSRDTLYFRFHVSPLSDASTEEYYAAFELFEGDAERLGVGNALGAYAYSAFFKTHNAEGANPAGDYVDLRSSSIEPSASGSGASYELPHRGQERTIVFKVQYVANGDDLITVWLNPDLSAGATEIHQAETLTTRFSANASFDELRLRHGGRGEGWVFSDLAVATSFADFVDPSRAMSPVSDPGRFFDQHAFGFEAWLSEPGMPRSPIHALAQTADGYLWLAGGSQLSRFDGVRFVAVNLPLELSGAPVTTLFGDSGGALWVGTQGRGLARYALGHFEVLTAAHGLPETRITTLAEAKDGRLWIGTATGVLVRDHDVFRKVKGLETLDGSEILTLFQDSTGVLWLVAAGRGVFRLQEGNLSQLADARVDPLLREARCLLVEPNGRLWIGAGDDLVLCREGAVWHRYRIPRQSAASSVRVLAATGDGTVWAGSPSEGLFRFKNGKLTALNPDGGSPETQASVLLVDREGNLWAGGGSGLRRLKRNHCFSLGQAEGLGRGIVSGLAEVAPGVVWATQPESGLYRWEGDAFRRLTAAGLPSADPGLSALLVTRDGACWLACTNGLLLFRDPQSVADESLLFALPQGPITALAEAPDGSVWAGTRQGNLWRLQQGEWHQHEKFTSESAITVLTFEPGGSLWVGTDGGGLYLVDDSIRAHFHRGNGLADDTVRALYLDGRGALWVGTETGGLIVVSNQVCTAFSTAAGLTDNSIRGILPDPLGRLWLNDSAGLTCISAPSLAGTHVEVQGVYPLGASRADDASPSGRNSGMLPQMKDNIAGRLWFGTFNGIAVVELPETSANPTSACLILEEVLVDGLPAQGFQPLAAGPRLPPGSLAQTPALQIGPGRHRVDLRYTSPQFSAPDKPRFRYRLEGLDRDWVEAGTARAAQYSYVPPGEYRFTVALYRPNGKFEEASVSLSVSQHVWQRPGVLAATAAVLFVAIAGGVRFAENRRMKRRLSRLEQQSLLDRERMRIAQDLHDEMGAKLCRISFLSEHANRFVAESGQVKEQVATIAQDSRELLHSLDEIVWAVNPHNDTLEHVGSYIGQYTQEYFQGTGIDCLLEIANDLPLLPVSSQVRHHLFLAVHEALTNVLKHSGATLVNVSVSCVGRELQIQVTDNGRGFALPASSAAPPRGEEGGNGLPNMRQRTEAVGGRCTVSSAPGQGTTIRFLLTLPLPAKDSKP